MLGSLLGQGGPAGGGDGAAILGHILGGRQSRAEAGIGQASGLDGGTVQQLLAMLAPLVMSFLAQRVQQGGLDAGHAHRFRMWMKPYARSILRDEFGRESTISVSDPTRFGEATGRAKDRLNALLEKHGVEVTSIVTPRPRFKDEYETLIESRNETENQQSVIASELQRAETDRARRLVKQFIARQLKAKKLAA